MWQTLESDPGLFNELVESWGVNGVEFEEATGLDADSLKAIAPDGILGVVFLFKYTSQHRAEAEAAGGKLVPDAPVYFAKQTTDNACATQALLALVMNTENEKVRLGEHLQGFKEFTSELPADLRGDSIASDDFLRNAHNKMCRPVSFIGDSRKPTEDDNDLFHYVTYVPYEGHLYELDGLQEAPIDHGPIEDPYQSISEALFRRIELFKTGELYFSALVAVPNKRDEYVAKGWDELAQEESAKHTAQLRENALRRQQYTGLAIELLKQMASGRAV